MGLINGLVESTSQSVKLSPADCSLDDYLLPSSFDASAQPNVNKCTLHTVSGAASFSRSEGDCPQSMIIRGTSILVSRFRARLLSKNWKNDSIRCTQPTTKEKIRGIETGSQNRCRIPSAIFFRPFVSNVVWMARTICDRKGSCSRRPWSRDNKNVVIDLSMTLDFDVEQRDARGSMAYTCTRVIIKAAGQQGTCVIIFRQHYY